MYQLNIQVRPRVAFSEVCQHEMEHTKQTAADFSVRVSVHAAPKAPLFHTLTVTVKY